MSALATANDLPVIDLRLNLPKSGVWHADVSVETEENLAGQVVVAVAGSRFVGTVREGGNTLGTWVGRLSAGQGGLRATLPAKQYREVPLSVPLGDILRVSKESLSREAQPAVTTKHLRGWVMRAGPAGEALVALMQLASSAWRFLPDGTLWVGTEAWRPVTLEHELLIDDPRERKAVVFTETPGSLLPGATFLDKHVSYVSHQLLDGVLRSHVWFET